MARYPLLAAAGVIGAAIAVTGLVLFIMENIKGLTLVYFLVGAAVVPFAAMAWRRRAPTASVDELVAMRDSLEAAHKAGEIPDDRYAAAKERVERALAKTQRAK